jgi:hypothetical protein
MHKPLVELEQQIASLQTLVSQLRATDSITPIEKEVLKQKCTTLYEQILQLPEIHLIEPIIVPEQTPAPVYIPELIIPVEQPEATPEVILTNDIPSIVEPKEPALLVPDLFAQVPKTETESLNENIEAWMLAEEQKKVEAPITPLRKEEAQELSLHEKIANTIPVKPDLSEKLSGNNIASLKAAINVNLKIAIVNDLFKENTVEYVKAIDKLNTSENIHEAMRYFTELKHTYDWDNNNALVKELESLINKRFN